MQEKFPLISDNFYYKFNSSDVQKLLISEYNKTLNNKIC